VALALLGLALAPILNGLADNLPRNDPTGANAIRRTTYVPRCAYCGEPQEGLAAHALLARFAGRPGCVHCGAPASRRAEWIAVALALLFSLLWVEGRHDALSLLGGAVAVFLFLLVTVLDLERRLVLLEVVVGGGLLLVIVSALRALRLAP